jgi:hypothetical protein
MFHQPLINEIEPCDRSQTATSKTTSRHTSGFPSALQHSPYLSSPIRPLPSFRSVSTRKSKRSVSGASRASSPRSTLGSLRLASPYSQSIFSLQSLNSSVSKSPFPGNKTQALNRSVLLPHEIDDIAKFLGTTIALDTEKESDNNDDEYELSDFDDESTVNSNCAKSLDDHAVYSHIENNKKEDINLGDRRISTLSGNLNSLEKDKSHSEESSEINQIKLPSVSAIERLSDSAKPRRKKKTKIGTSSKRSKSPRSLTKSPYAMQMNPKKPKSKATASSLNKANMVFGSQ